jgi:hypothetical protein
MVYFARATSAGFAVEAANDIAPYFLPRESGFRLLMRKITM